VSSKWCYRWPHCACGIDKAQELKAMGGKLLVYMDDVGDLKRVPVSELEAFAFVEELSADQLVANCPRTRGGDTPN